MRVLVLGTDAFGGHGGIARYNTDLLTALCSHPAITEVVALMRLSPVHATGPLPDKLTYVTSGFNSKTRYLQAVFQTIRGSGHFDLLVCAHLRLLPIALLAQCLIRAPICLMIYGVDVWNIYVDRLSRVIVGKIDAFISISDFTTTKFLEWARVDLKRGYLLPNAIHLELYGLAPKNQDLTQQYQLAGKKVLITLGRLAFKERNKGFDEVLDVLPGLVKEVENVVYIVAGNGNDRARLEAKAENLGVREHVVFTGYVPEEAKADYYRLADAFVMPSRSEGFGFVCLEALACGVPVVASALDGTKEAILAGEMGILVNPNNLSDVQAGIIEALQRPTGIVPQQLSAFAYPNFEKRCHAIIDELLHLRKPTLAER